MHGSLDLILCARYARSSPMSLASHSARCVPLFCRQTQHHKTWQLRRMQSLVHRADATTRHKTRRSTRP
jgi:hypothetical protein